MTHEQQSQIPFTPPSVIPSIEAKWNELREGYGPPSDNPHPFNSYEWRIWQAGADATNDKWLRAIVKMPEARS